jgi:hypothetical protein
MLKRTIRASYLWLPEKMHRNRHQPRYYMPFPIPLTISRVFVAELDYSLLPLTGIFCSCQTPAEMGPSSRRICVAIH